MQPYCRSAEPRNGFPVGDQDQRLVLYLPGKSFQQLPFRFFHLHFLDIPEFSIFA